MRIYIEDSDGQCTMEFWTVRAPFYIHRLSCKDAFDGPRFATIDEGDELTVVSTFGGTGAAGPYRCFTLGPFDLHLVGVLAKVSAALAKRDVPVFVVSTYRYDHILVPMGLEEETERALLEAGLVRKDGG